MPPKKSTKKRAGAPATPPPSVDEPSAPKQNNWAMALVIFGLLLFIVAIVISKNKVSNQDTSEQVTNSTPSPSLNTNVNLNTNVSLGLTNTTEETPKQVETAETSVEDQTVVAEPQTLVKNAVAPAAWFPNQQRFVYTTDIEGESLGDPFHKVQLNIYNLNDGSSKAVPSGTMMAWDIPRLLTMFNDGSGFGFVTWDEQVVMVTPEAETTIMKTPRKYKTSGDFSPDGKFFVYTTVEGAVMKLDVAAAKITSLGSQTYPQPTATETVDAPSYLSPSYSPDGGWIAFERRFPIAERTVYRTDPEVAVALLSTSAASIDSMTVIGKSYIIETEGYTTFDWSSDGRYVSHSWSGSVFDTATKSVVLQADDRFEDAGTKILVSKFAPMGDRLLQTVTRGDLTQMQYLNLPSTTANVTPAGNTNWRSSPIWDPSGSVIFSYNDASNPSIIERIDLIDRSTRTLVESGQKLSQLVVAPDGTALLFSAQTQGDDDSNKNEIRKITLP